MNVENLLTTDQVARRLGLGETRLRLLISTGRIRPVLVLNGWRLFDPTDVERLAAELAQRQPTHQTTQVA
jgi:DNA-binding transcriptional MerR regulator